MSDRLNDPDEFLPSRFLRERYKVSGKTLRDWERDGILPAPDRIKNRKYWRRRVLEEAERAGMHRKTSAKPDTA
jgi:hypothetical protein